MLMHIVPGHIFCHMNMFRRGFKNKKKIKKVKRRAHVVFVLLAAI